jgi:hypothetical protein
MGCGLNKLEKRDEKRPGNIYSTLKRPQVETKVDVSYEYRFLEFTTLSAGEYAPAIMQPCPRGTGDNSLQLSRLLYATSLFIAARS